ncbi:hypothetical protein QF035_007414 [Streptomyces umbrinus]|uniref:Uncharacterized protein n=1 Tax=Streptomyces umbrinus TaxID=67370 RepID=A0ABU0T2B6_9ACTN|nr:hypothetical protein [Streptomyces umbrinus]
MGVPAAERTDGPEVAEVPGQDGVRAVLGGKCRRRGVPGPAPGRSQPVQRIRDRRPDTVPPAMALAAETPPAPPAPRLRHRNTTPLARPRSPHWIPTHAATLAATPVRSRHGEPCRCRRGGFRDRSDPPARGVDTSIHRYIEWITHRRSSKSARRSTPSRSGTGARAAFSRATASIPPCAESRACTTSTSPGRGTVHSAISHAATPKILLPDKPWLQCRPGWARGTR